MRRFFRQMVQNRYFCSCRRSPQKGVILSLCVTQGLKFYRSQLLFPMLLPSKEENVFRDNSILRLRPRHRFKETLQEIWYGKYLSRKKGMNRKLGPKISIFNCKTNSIQNFNQSIQLINPSINTMSFSVNKLREISNVDPHLGRRTS